MADLDISIGAKDEASPAFKKVSESAKQLGKDTEAGGKQAAKGTESLAGSLVKAQLAFEALRVAGRVALDLLKGGIADYIEQEKANTRLAAAVRQLGYDANTLTPALVSMADEMEHTTLVTSEQIQQIQQMLLRYGVAPRDIRATTQALLDYGAVSGKSASEATETLMQALVGGGNQMQAFGVTVGRTGDKAKDLQAIVAQMSEQFGGSARAATEGFAGSIGRLELAQQDLGKAFAQFIADVDGRYHIIDSLTQALDGARIALAGDKEQEALEKRNQQYIKQLETIGRVGGVLKQLRKELAATPEDAAGFGGRSRREELQEQIAEQEALLSKFKSYSAQVREAVNSALNRGASGVATAISTGNTAIAAATKEGFDHIDNIRDLHHKAALDAFKAVEEEAKLDAKIDKDLLAQFAQNRKQAAEDSINALKSWQKREAAEWQRLMGQSQSRAGQLSVAVASTVQDEGADQMQAAGFALGSALVSGLDQALTQMEGGGEMDVGSIIASVLPALVTAGLIAATGGAAAPFAPLIGAAVGVLAKHAVNSLDTPKYGGSKYHSGGVVDDRPRFHDGGGLASDEVDAVLQTGEVVWDRGDVARNGGPRAVNAMRGGGAGMHVTVQAMDAQSFQEWIGDRGGSGVVRALNQNRGELAQRFRRLERRR